MEMAVVMDMVVPLDAWGIHTEEHLQWSQTDCTDQVNVDPLAHIPISSEKKGPVMLGDLLAARRLRRTGEMSFLKKPAHKYFFIDHTSNWMTLG